MDELINQLKPGQSIEISRVGDIYCTVERSGNGKTLRYVRHFINGFQVFKTTNF